MLYCHVTHGLAHLDLAETRSKPMKRVDAASKMQQIIALFIHTAVKPKAYIVCVK